MMFCDEHGTADYCPDCLADEKDKELLRLQKELDELKASIPHLISNAIYEALVKFGPTNGYHAIDLVDHMEEFADQLTSKE